MALTLAVGSISYDLGQGDAEKKYTGQIAGLQEQAKYNEDVRNRLRESRDESENKALTCTRALDASMHELAYKGDVLFDVYTANTPEEREGAMARVENWYEDRDDVQERLDQKVAQCTGMMVKTSN